MLAKKNSIHSRIISLVNKPGVGARDGAQGGLFRPCKRFATFVERVDWRCVSRNSLITFALDPLGPFFCGMALYVHESVAEEQLRHGVTPSHLTFRRWQASQARFTEVGAGAAADVEDDGVDEDMMATIATLATIQRSHSYVDWRYSTTG